MTKDNKMKINNAKDSSVYNYLEKWDTRYGVSERIVIRKNGKFVNNISLTALKNEEQVTSQ